MLTRVCWSKKGYKHLLQGRREIYRFITNYSSRFPVEKMCKVLKVSRSGYYNSLKDSESKRAKENKDILSLIEQVHKKSKQRYGSPRIHQVLKAKQVHVSRPRVARLMKKAQIRAKMKRRFKVTTDSKHNYTVCENLLERNFTATATAQAWVSDMDLQQNLHLGPPTSGH